MVRVLLVQPPHRDTFGYSMPPVGLLHLASAARDAGHAVAVLDLALLVRRGDIDPGPDGEALIPACVAHLLGPQEWSDDAGFLSAAPLPDVVGIGAMVSSMPATLHLVEGLRERAPGVRVILGGQGPEAVEEAIVARHPGVDAVAVGEAEGSFVQWLTTLEAAPADGRPGEDASEAAAAVPGLVLRRDGRPHRTPPREVMADLDVVPPPAWDLVESPAAYAAAAGSDEGLVPIDLGRGCSFHCTFCTTPLFWQRRARHLSPARAVDELDRIAALPGADCAYVTHDLFTADRERVLEICAEKLRRGNTLPFECRTRLDLVDAELLSVLRQAGCRRILYGVESDRPEVLARIAKGGRQEQGLDVRAALAEASRSGVASIVGTMCGVPGEDADDVEANLQLMADAALIDGTSLSLHWFNVLPGNDRAAEVGDGLGLVPGLTADLVRGFDVPAGRVARRQRELIEDDPEVFAAFRVAPAAHATPEQLFLLSRHAHLLLEALPRSMRALAEALDASLLSILHRFLEASCAAAPRPDGPGAWPEPRLMDRAEAVRLFVSHGDRRLHEAGVDPDHAGRVRALLHYEHALLSTEGPALRRFAVDPLPLLRAAEHGEPLAAVPPEPRAVLFVRDGPRVAAHALSDFLADVAEHGDEASLVRRWPNAHVDDVLKARALLAGLGVEAPLTPARGDTHSPSPTP